VNSFRNEFPAARGGSELAVTSRDGERIPAPGGNAAIAGTVIEFVRGDLAAVARTTMSHPEHGLKVTLYPLFHIGSPAFYDALSEDLKRFRVIFLEGVRWRGLKGPLYDLAARNLGLATQRERLRLPAGAERLRLDMTDADFANAADRLPVWWRLFLRLLRPIFWAATATAAGRDWMWDAFSKERYVRGVSDDETKLEELIRTRRDRAMSQCLRAFLADPVRIERALPVAVLAGAAHMPALYATLRDCGFEKGTVRWFEVLDGLTIPSRGTDGRARRA
jgi:hypothetical protein